MFESVSAFAMSIMLAEDVDTGAVDGVADDVAEEFPETMDRVRFK